jgi:tRNA (cytidine32/uridine32-2'-O)-methyltransferase
MAAVATQRADTAEHKEYDRLANNEELQKFYAHLEQTLIDIKYLNPNVEKQLLSRLKRFFNRAALEINELNIFRGIFNAAQKKAK